MVSCSSSASRLPSRRCRNTWCRGKVGRCRPGRPSFAIMRRGLHRLISLWSPRWRLSSYSGSWCLAIAAAGSRSEEHTSELQSHRDLHSFPTRRSSDLNHAEGIASIDLFVVPTVAFEQLFGFLVLGHSRRRLIWSAVTAHPTAEWLARQITEAR